MKRRQFIGQSSAALAGTAALSIAPWADVLARRNARPVAPSDQVTIGAIGLKGICKANLESAFKYAGVRLAAVADVDDAVVAQMMPFYEGAGHKPAVHKDFRRLLEDKSLDAVLVCTPDHWHTLMTAASMQAGKHVYVEKPLANTIAECDYLRQATKQYGKVVQVGQQQRSASHWADAVAYVQGGKLGRIRQVKCWCYAGFKGAVPVLPDGPVPAGVDYPMWLGPAPIRPFNPNRFHFTWRWYWDYAGGLMTDWGVHILDMALLAMKAADPKSVVASGGKYAFPTDAMQTPDTMTAIYEFDDFLLTWEHTIGMALGPYGRSHGIAFIGENGTLVADRGGWEVLPEVSSAKPPLYKVDTFPMRRAASDGRTEHLANFFDAIKTQKPVACPIDEGARVASIAHMGNIAFRLGRKVFWERDKRQFRTDKEANAMMAYNYQNGWKLPSV